MKEKEATPEYCENNKKKIRAYQCEICERLDVDDATDKVLARLRQPGRVPRSVQTDNGTRTHRRSPLICPIRTERGAHNGKR